MTAERAVALLRREFERREREGTRLDMSEEEKQCERLTRELSRLTEKLAGARYFSRRQMSETRCMPSWAL